jgi:hypothetical protein
MIALSGIGIASVIVLLLAAIALTIVVESWTYDE